VRSGLPLPLQHDHTTNTISFPAAAPAEKSHSLKVNLLSEKHRLLRRTSDTTAIMESIHGSGGAKLTTYMDSSHDCIQLLDMSQQGWRVLLSNQNWIQATGKYLYSGVGC
jgi:hypothetical protein